jgi:predicted transcriptional regulator of viral defense system
LCNEFRPSLFNQCYIGGWTAANHWDLTEQLFNETLVFTTRRVKEKRVIAQGAVVVLHSVKQKRFFGLKTLWPGSVKVHISDPARTLVDMIAAPELGGGIDHVADTLSTYLKTKADRDLLIRYAGEFKNGVIFKRLGYLAETRLHDNKFAAECRSGLTQGCARLDPALPPERLVTAWRLWLPSALAGDHGARHRDRCNSRTALHRHGNSRVAGIALLQVKSRSTRQVWDGPRRDQEMGLYN